MTYGYAETSFADVLLAPFVIRAAAAFLVFVLLRPLLARMPLDRLFANPPAVELCLFVMLTSILLVAF